MQENSFSFNVIYSPPRLVEREVGATQGQEQDQ